MCRSGDSWGVSIHMHCGEQFGPTPIYEQQVVWLLHCVLNKNVFANLLNNS